MSRQGWTKTSVLELNHSHRNVNQGRATASTQRGLHHLYIVTLNWTPQPQECQSRDSNCVYTTRTSPSIYSNFINWTPQPQECQSRDSNCVYTTRTSPSIYSNFKLDTTTTGMLIKGQQLRLHYEDFTTYIIYLNRTPQQQECLSRDSNCVYTTRTSPPI